MSYQVLARKYRPRGFSEVIGQEHAVRALANALDRDQLHHAYLFTGTRGVGKTTLARILAACLNCETGVSSTPCGTCSACTSIREGRFVDLIEVDAASRTGVDDTRDLLNNVQYLPTNGRFKVYLIDEVHMLSTSSFNALLKTLEEPPEHVKFLLATTEAKRIPVTVLSRCLQINLKNIPPETIVGQLVEILKHEEIDFEDEALRILARAADGSMRDAESLTDQAIAHGGGSVSAASVVDMLGVAGGHEIAALLDALSQRDTRALLDLADELSNRSANLADVLGALIRAFHDLAIGLETGAVADETLEPFRNRFHAEDLQLYYQIALMGNRDLPFAPDAKTGFDMTLLRLGAFEPMAAGSAEGPSNDAATAAAPAGTTGQASAPPTSAAPSGLAPTPGRSPAAGSPQTQPPSNSNPARSAAREAARATESVAAGDQREVALDRASEGGLSEAEPDQAPRVAAEPIHASPPSAPQATATPSRKTEARKAEARKAEARNTEVRKTEARENETHQNPEHQGDASEPTSEWFEIVAQLQPRGVSLMILDNSNLLHRSDSRWVIRLDEDHDTLLNDKQKTEINAMLAQYLDSVVRIDWETGPLAEETPGARKQRIERERYDNARSSLLESESVQVLMREFDATLMEVTTIDPATDRPSLNK